MRILRTAAIRALDQATIAHHGVSSLELMERAGRGCAERMQALIPRLNRRDIHVFCGKGNNGGDGLVVARYLAADGCRVVVYLTHPATECSPETRANLEKLPPSIQRIELHTLRDIPDFATDLGDEAVVVDALLGVGIAPGGLKEPLRTLITALDACHAEVVAIDVPSGTGEDNGQVTDPALHATLTLTIGYPKVGLYLEPATFYAGRIEVIPLDYPGALTDDMAALSILDPIEVGRLLVPRVPSSHKGTYGRLLIIGGSRGMPGSVGLAAEAAFRAGVGAVVVATAASAQPIVAGFLREAMTVALPETPEGVISPEAMRTLLPHLEWATAIALGPGLTTHPAAAAFTGALLDHWPGPLVLDADGLKIAGKRLKLLGERTLPAVCTPHLGEASALLGRAREEIQSRRLDVALESSRDYNLVLLLKGYRTVIASPEGRASISVVGNPGMATAGTGDVLTGIIGGLLAQGVAPYDAARAGAYLHGSAGDGAAAEVGEISLMAGDLIRFLPRAVQAAMGSEV